MYTIPFILLYAWRFIAVVLCSLISVCSLPCAAPAHARTTTAAATACNEEDGSINTYKTNDNPAKKKNEAIMLLQRRRMKRH